MCFAVLCVRKFLAFRAMESKNLDRHNPSLDLWEVSCPSILNSSSKMMDFSRSLQFSKLHSLSLPLIGPLVQLDDCEEMEWQMLLTAFFSLPSNFTDHRELYPQDHTSAELMVPVIQSGSFECL